LLYQSENFSQTVCGTDHSFLGRQYDNVIDDCKFCHALRGVLGLPTIHEQRERVGTFAPGVAEVEVSAYTTNGIAVVEFEQTPAAEQRLRSPIATVRSMMATITQGEGVKSMLQSSVRALRHLTGHDRVMAYRFLDNGDGEVVAEAAGPGIEPYLGLRYPAWDIPTQVRQVMLRAPFRIIRNIRDDRIAVIAAPGAAPLDMALSHLRGVSPIHIEYLENMGVRATMNVSIVWNGRLWGMFAFHHYRPRHLSPDQRTICELFGQLGSMLIQQEEERARMQRRTQTRALVESVSDSSDSSDSSDVSGVLRQHALTLLHILAADGVCTVQAGVIDSIGQVPHCSVTLALIDMMADEMSSVESLQDVMDWPNVDLLGESAGVLLHRLGEHNWLAFYRNEVIHEIRWAGNKQKELTYGPNGPRLTPRASFAEYRESVAGRCRPWTEADIEVSGEIARELWKTIHKDLSADARKLERQKLHQDLLIAELNHRVRNTLALVRSIARQTSDASASVEQYVSMLEQRIEALSTAHNLIGGSGLQWARIVDLVRAELKPYEHADNAVSITGPPLAVRADVAPVIALLIHEMATNAVKYGALSGNAGELSVSWFGDTAGVTIRWVEELPVAVSEPERRGFGLALIERALPYECNGRSSVQFAGRQLRIEFWLPEQTIKRLAAGESQNVAAPKPSARTIEMDLSHLRSVLVLEDNLVLAMELERTLLDLGVKDVDALPTAELAQHALQNKTYDCGLLDINLGEGTSFEIAEQLISRGAGVVLASGYDSKYELPASLIEVPRVTKPVSRTDLIRSMCIAIGNTSQ
jgi:light-regulated signal transduction histidine kinase (bacteriophytochrome)/CheY-like chemotaxis protein